MEQEVERPVKGPLTRRRSGAVSTPERVLRSRTDKSDGSPPATAAITLREGTPSRAGTPKREGTPKRALKKPGDNVTETPKRRSVRASSAQPEDSPANKKVLNRRRSTSLQPETPKKEDKTIVTRSKLSTVASEKTVAAVSTRSRRSVAPSISSSSEPSNKVSPEPVKEIKRITRRSASNSPGREIASKAAVSKATRRSSLLKSTDSSPVCSPEPETSSDKTPSLIPRKRHARNLGLSPVEEIKDETGVPNSSNADVKPDNSTDSKSSQDIATVEPTQSTVLISDVEVCQIKVEQVSPVQTPNTSVKSEVLSPNGSTSHDKNESCAESEDSGIKEMEEFNSLEEKVSDKVSNVITDQVDIGSEVFEDQNNDPNSKLIQITMADKGKTVKGLDKKNLSYKENPSKLKTPDKNTSRLSPVVSLVRLNADNIPEISRLMNEGENKKTLRSLDKTEPISSNLEEKTEASPIIEEDKNNTSELVPGEGFPDDKKLSIMTPLIKLTSILQNQNYMHGSILSKIIDKDSAKVDKSVNISETFEGNKIEAIKEQSEFPKLQITPDDISAKEKSEHTVKTPRETSCNEDLDFTLKIDSETEAEKTNADDAVTENKSKSVQDVRSNSKESENSNILNNDNLNLSLSKEIEPENKSTEVDLSLTTEAEGVKESTSASSNLEMESTDKSVSPLSPTSTSKEDNTEVSPALSNLSKGDIVEKSDERPVEMLKSDHASETDISIQTADASVQDTLNDSQVDTNYSLLVNVSYDSVTDKKEESKSTDDLEKMDITSGDTISSEPKTTDHENDVEHPVVGDEEKPEEKDENDDAPEYLDASLVSSDDSFMEKKVASTKEKSPKLRRSHRESERKESRKRSLSGDKEELISRMKHSPKLDVSTDESKESERKSDKKEVPYYPDCSMISDDSFAEVKDDTATASSYVVSEKIDHQTISSDPIKKNYKVQEKTSDTEKVKPGELDNSPVSNEAKEIETSLIPSDCQVEEKDEIKPLKENVILEESKQSLNPDKSADQENTEKTDENKTLEHSDNSVSAEASCKVMKEDESKPVSDIDPSTSVAELSGTSDEIHVGKELNKQSVEQSITLTESSGISDEIIVGNKSDDKPVDQSITLTESSGITDENIVENKSDDKPVDQSITLTESSGITDETKVENKSDDKPVDQSITLTESSGVADEITVENKSDDKPVNQSITLMESSGVADEITVENKSDNKPVNQAITLMESSGISDKTMIENKSDETMMEDKSNDQSVVETIALSESSAISNENIVENKFDEKSVTQIEISAVSDETTVENKSDKKSVTDIMDTTQAETTDICKETTVDKISESDAINSSTCQAETSGAFDESLILSKSNNDASPSEQAINQVDTPSICNENKSKENDDLEIVDTEISGGDNDIVVDQDNASSICDKTLVQNTSTNDLNNFTCQADASSDCNKTLVQEDTDEKSVSEALESADDLNKSASQCDSSSVCDKSIAPGDSSTDTLEYPSNQGDISGTGDETMSRGKSVGDALEHSTNNTSVEERTDTSGVCEQQPTDEKTSDDNLKDTIFDTRSESAAKVDDKSSDEVGKIISIDDSTNDSQEPLIEGADAVQPGAEEINTTVTLSDTESQEIVLVKSSSESDDSEPMVTRGKKAPIKETGNDKNGALSEKVEEESSSESSCSDSEEEGSSSSPLEEHTVRARDFIDDEADEGEETQSSDEESIEESQVLHIQQKQDIPKKKRQFIVCDESSETQSSSEDLSPQPKKKSKLSCVGDSKDHKGEVSKKSNVPDIDKKDKKRTLTEDTKSSVQKKSKIRKLTPSPHPEFEVIDSNNENVEMDGNYLKNIEFRVRKCSESYLTHRLADNLNNSHATGGVFKVVSLKDCSKITSDKIKNKISCNINFKVEKYPTNHSESLADKPYFCGIEFEVTQKRIHKIKSINATMTVLPKNNESLDSVGKLKKGDDTSTSSSRLIETNLDNFNENSNSLEAKTKKSKRKLDDNLRYENFLHSITLHDSSSEPECSRSKKEVDSDELLNEQPFSQPKIKCLKPCYSATIQNLGTGINALDLISLFTKLGIQGIEEIDLSICLPRLFCKKLGYGNIRFSNEEAMQQCVDMSRKVKLRGEELWMRACYCYRPLNRKASHWLTQSNAQFSEKTLKYMRKQKKTVQT